MNLPLKRKHFRTTGLSVSMHQVSTRIVVPLEGMVETETRILLTNLIQELLQVNPRARPSAQELKALFNILIDNTPITTLKSGSPLLSKICRSLSR